MMELGQEARMIEHNTGNRWNGIITKIIKDDGKHPYAKTAPIAIIEEIEGNRTQEVYKSDLWWNADKEMWYQFI